MKTRTVFVLVSGALWAVSVGGCAEGQSQLKSNPLPSVSSISPSTVTLGAQSFSLTVNGSNFLSTSVVRWNGADRATTFVSGSQLTAAILASDIASAGTTNISVFNPAPGGGTSSAATFTINNPVPIVSALGPSNAIAGTSAFTLTVDGSNFVSSSVVRWNGSNRSTTFVSSTRLTAAVPAADVASAAIANVTVFNATPGGGSSNAMGFTVMPGQLTPVISWFSPGSIMAGGPEFTLTVYGSGYVQNSVVRWNRSDRSTTFVSSTQLSAAILATDIASTGTATIEVFNPQPAGGGSGLLAYYVSPQGIGVVERVSVDNNGAQLENADSYVRFPGISGDGRFVAFDSIVYPSYPTTAAPRHVFVRDICRGGPSGCTPSTVQASVANDGSHGNDWSAWPAISADGRFVAFSSDSSNLVPDDTNGLGDVMLRDTCAGAPVGCTPSTVRVSVASDGTQGNGESYLPTISANGRFVAFSSGASNLVPDDTNGTGDTFVRDTCLGAPAGCTPSTVRVSVANDGSQANDSSFGGSISANGRFVAFASGATNLVPGYTGPADVYQGDVFVRDTCLAAPAGCTPSTTLVSVVSGSGGNEGAGGGDPVISANGRFVTFGSYSSNLVVGDTNDNGDVFVRDTCLGAPSGCTPSTTLVSVGIGGNQGNNDSWISWGAPVSGDGRFVAFSTYATNFVPGGYGQLDVFVRDTCAGAPADCIPNTVRVNVNSDGSPGSNVYDEYVDVALSADGRFAAFYSSAGLVSGDTNGYCDVFLARTGAGAADASTVTSTASSYGSIASAYFQTAKANAGAAPSSWSIAEGTRPRRTDLSFIRARRRAQETARAPVPTQR